MFELISLWRQLRRCRRGDHEWQALARTRESDFVCCAHCAETGFRIKEST